MNRAALLLGADVTTPDHRCEGLVSMLPCTPMDAEGGEVVAGDVVVRWFEVNKTTKEVRSGGRQGWM